MPTRSAGPPAPQSMTREPRSDSDGERSETRHFAIGLARAFGGAVIFGLPMLMTMEMWELGATMEPLRLALLLLLSIPLLIGLSHVSGFEETFGVVDDTADAFVACVVGFVVGGGVLALFGVIGPGMPMAEIVAEVALQAVPGSIGALLAQSQFGPGNDSDDDEELAERRRPSSYFSQLFLMAVGALFLGFNVAPTEEMLIIGYITDPAHVLVMIAVSLALIHGFVYALEFSGQEVVAPGTPFWSEFLRFTVVGYAIALLISAYLLWTFGRLDNASLEERITAIVVLGFPATIGAAAARLIL